MYNRLYEFLEFRSLLQDIQFVFRLKHSTFHSLIHLTDTIQDQIEKGKIGCFVDSQKFCHTVDHNILIQKLNYYGTIGTANNSWCSSYLENRT